MGFEDVTRKKKLIDSSTIIRASRFRKQTFWGYGIKTNLSYGKERMACFAQVMEAFVICLEMFLDPQLNFVLAK